MTGFIQGAVSSEIDVLGCGNFNSEDAMKVCFVDYANRFLAKPGEEEGVPILQERRHLYTKARMLNNLLGLYIGGFLKGQYDDERALLEGNMRRIANEEPRYGAFNEFMYMHLLYAFYYAVEHQKPQAADRIKDRKDRLWLESTLSEL